MVGYCGPIDRKEARHRCCGRFEQRRREHPSDCRSQHAFRSRKWYYRRYRYRTFRPSSPDHRSAHLLPFHWLPSFYQPSIHSALLSRTIDTDLEVLTALYSLPLLITPILLSNSSTYISALSYSLTDISSPSRQLIRTHLTYLAHHFTKHPDAAPSGAGDGELVKKVFEELVWSFLLWSKPRQKTAAVVWEILGSEEATSDPARGVANYELLSGCIDAMKWEEQSAGESYETASRVNLAIANKMAETVLMSNRHAEHFDFLLSTLRDTTNGHASGLGYLVVRALLGRMAGEHQVKAAERVLEAMGLKGLEVLEVFMRGSGSLQEVCCCYYTSATATNFSQTIDCPDIVFILM